MTRTRLIMHTARVRGVQTRRVCYYEITNAERCLIILLCEGEAVMRTMRKLVSMLLAAMMLVAVIPVQAVTVTPANYTVTYDALGGEGAPETQIKQHGVDLTLSDVVPTWENRNFNGWHKVITAAGQPWVSYQPGQLYTADEDLALEAQWSPAWTPRISLGSVSAKPGETAELPIYIADNLEAERIHGEIELEAVCDGVSITDIEITNQQVENGQIGVVRYRVPVDAAPGEHTVEVSVKAFNLWIAGADAASYNFSYRMPCETAPGTLTVLPAEGTRLTVIYDANGGTGAPAAQTGEGSAVIPDGMPTRVNGRFMYWQDKDGRSYRPGDTVYGIEDMTLKAVWALEIDPSVQGPVVSMRDRAYAEPGEIMEIPVRIHCLDGIVAASLEAAFGSSKVMADDTVTSDGAPEFIDYIPLDTPQRERDGSYVIGTARYRVPQDAAYLDRYFVHFYPFEPSDIEMIQGITRLTVSDAYGELIVIENMKHAADGAEELRFMFEAFASDRPVYVIAYQKSRTSTEFVTQYFRQGDEVDLQFEQDPDNGAKGFEGWSAWIDGEERFFYPGDTLTYTVNADLYLNCIWRDTLNIEYYVNDELYLQQTKKRGETAQISTQIPTREGYVFTEWTAQVNGTTVAFAPGSEYTADADLCLYAQWQLDENYNSIMYLSHGLPDNMPQDGAKKKGTTGYISTQVPTREGYTFLGWNEVRYGDSHRFAPGAAYSKDEDLRLYAKWQRDSGVAYRIKYYANAYYDDTVSNLPDMQESSDGSPIALSTMIPSRPNGVFVYWENVWEGVKYQPGETVNPSDHMALFAMWALDWDYSRNVFLMLGSVTCRPGDTVEIPVYMQCDKDLKVEAVGFSGSFIGFEEYTGLNKPVPQFIEYTPCEEFEWDTERNRGMMIGTAKYYIPKNIDPDGSYYAHLDNISLEIGDEYGYMHMIIDDRFVANGEMALAANGPIYVVEDLPDTYTVTFNANGGSGRMSAVSGVSGAYTLPRCAFTAPAGKQFKGWATSANGAVLTGNTYNVAANTTLYAVWEDISEPATAAITVGSAASMRGKEVFISISIADNPGIAALNFKIDYDKTRLKLTGCNHLSELDWTVNLGEDAGAVLVGTKNYTADGNILNLCFKVLDDAPDGMAQITLTGLEALDVNENTVLCDVTAGGVEVFTKVSGDVSGDGSIDALDALRLKKHLAGMAVEVNMTNADVNADGRVSIADLLRLMKYLAGMDVKLQ